MRLTTIKHKALAGTGQVLPNALSLLVLSPKDLLSNQGRSQWEGLEGHSSKDQGCLWTVDVMDGREGGWPDMSQTPQQVASPSPSSHHSPPPPRHPTLLCVLGCQGPGTSVQKSKEGQGRTPENEVTVSFIC